MGLRDRGAGIRGQRELSPEVIFVAGRIGADNLKTSGGPWRVVVNVNRAVVASPAARTVQTLVLVIVLNANRDSCPPSERVAVSGE